MENLTENKIIDRIKAVRQEKYGTRGKSKFARDLGISPSTYNYYEDNRVPPIETLVKMCKATGTDLNWLLTGEKTTKNPSYAANNNDFDTKKTPYALFASENISLLRQLDSFFTSHPNLIDPTLAFIDLLSETTQIEKKTPFSDAPSRFLNQHTNSDPAANTLSANNQNSNPTPAVSTANTFINKELDTDTIAIDSPAGKYRPDWIPVLGRTAAGIVYRWDQLNLNDSEKPITKLSELVYSQTGKDIINSIDGQLKVDLHRSKDIGLIKDQAVSLIQLNCENDEMVTEFLQSLRICELFPDSFGLYVDGDSMSPRINDGDMLILSPSVRASQGQICVAKAKNQIGVTCKLIRMTDESIHLIPVNEKYETKVLPKSDLDWALAVLCHVQL